MGVEAISDADISSLESPLHAKLFEILETGEQGFKRTLQGSLSAGADRSGICGGEQGARNKLVSLNNPSHTQKMKLRLVNHL